MLRIAIVPFSRNGAIPIFPHLLVLTDEKNQLRFIGQFPEKALETKLLYASLLAFLATVGAY